MWSSTARWPITSGGCPPAPVRSWRPAVPAGFTALAVVYGVGDLEELAGAIEELPDLSAGQAQHLASGKTLLVSTGTSVSRIMFGRAVNDSDLSQGILWAELDMKHLWGLGATAGVSLPGFHLCVLGESWQPLHCDAPAPDRIPQQIAQRRVGGVSTFEWNLGEVPHLAAYWPVFLKYAYATPNWTLVLSEPQSAIQAGSSDLTLMLVLVIGLTLAGIILLASTQIRRNLNPLVELEKGTERIASGDFSQPVVVASGDEFEYLADSFNTMSGRVEQQIATFEAISEIDRAVLAASDRDSIIQTVLSRGRDILSCDAFAISLREGTQYEKHRVHAVVGCTEERTYEARLGPDETLELLRTGDYLAIDAAQDPRAYLSLDSFKVCGITGFVVLPIVLQRELLGMLMMGFKEPAEDRLATLDDARRIRAQFTVALSNMQLISRLDQMSWGAIRALARAIDAKSQWTAGHSERVTNMALSIGRRLGLSGQEMELLRRGGLLHDIGKIGVPASILDKPTRLTDEEFETVKQHPQMGAKILAPITAYADVIPIVLFHHERYGGGGYPQGLVGDRIPLLARVLAVADVFDAVTTPRPYRGPMTTEEAVQLIRRDSGTHFDPAIVSVFVALMADRAAEEAEGAEVEAEWPDEPAALTA